MQNKEKIIVSSAIGVTLLALAYVHRTVIKRNYRKAKLFISEKMGLTPEVD